MKPSRNYLGTIIWWYAIMAVFLYTSIRDIGLSATELEFDSPIIGSLRGCDVAFALGAVWVGINHIKLGWLFRNRLIIPYATIVSLFAAIGLLRSGAGVFFNNDIRVWLMLPLGAVLGVMIHDTKYPLFHLATMSIFLATIMAWATYRDPASAYYSSPVGALQRIVNINVYNCSAMLWSLGAYLLTIGLSTGLRLPLLGGGIAILGQAIIAVISATRSMLGVLGVCLLFVVIVAVRLLPDPRRKFNRKVGLRVGLIALVVGLCALPYAGNIATYSELLYIRTIGVTQESGESTDSRLAEIQALFNSFDMTDYLAGRGFGGRFPSPIYDNDLWPELHIGIFTFALKGGLGLMLLVMYVLLWELPRRFVRAYFKSPDVRLPHDWGILLVTPMVYAPAMLLFLSGGYTTFTFLGWGIAYGAYVSNRKLLGSHIFPGHQHASVMPALPVVQARLAGLR